MEYVSGGVPPEVLIVVLGYGTPTVAVAGIEVVVITGFDVVPLLMQLDSTAIETHSSATSVTARIRSMIPPEYSATQPYRM